MEYYTSKHKSLQEELFMKKKVYVLLAACMVLVFSLTACADNNDTNNSVTEDQADFNGDGVNDVSGTDLNGDGIADGFGYDENGDGIADGVVGDYNDTTGIDNGTTTNGTTNGTTTNGTTNNNAKNGVNTTNNTDGTDVDGDGLGETVGDGVDDVITGVENAVDDITGNNANNNTTNNNNTKNNNTTNNNTTNNKR